MREKAKELQRQRMESQKKGLPMGRGGYGNSSDNFGSSSGISSQNSISTPSIGIGEISKPSPTMQYAICSYIYLMK